MICASIGEKRDREAPLNSSLQCLTLLVGRQPIWKYNFAAIYAFTQQKRVYWHSSAAWDANALYDANTELEEKDEEKHKEVDRTVTSTTDKHTQL